MVVGFSGAGKTYLSRIISKKLSIKHYDLDKEIEKKYNITISNIFLKYKEKTFRNFEKNTFLFLLKKRENFIISLGAGIIYFKYIRCILQKEKNCFFLNIHNPNIQYRNIILDKNLNKSFRPLAKNKQYMIYLNKKRYLLYKSLGKKSIFIISNNINDIINQITY